MALSSEIHSSAGSKAYGVIRELILSGRAKAGERLKEDELTTLTKVSRTPVREALRRLAIEGLVVVTPNAGAQVAAVGQGELAEIYTLRAMIEGYAAERAAPTISDGDIARLEDLSAIMREALDETRGPVESGRAASANAEFHRIVLDASMSPRLSAMAALVIDLPLTLRTFAHYSAEDRARSLRHHGELIQALRARDAVWAGSVMRSHIHAALHALLNNAEDSERTTLQVEAVD